MGRDKGQLRDGGGRELWRRQVDLLRGLGAGELLLSCRAEQGYMAEEGLRLVWDEWEAGGPLGGIVGCLEAMRAPLLVVLAVDLPDMARDVLTCLLEAARKGGGGAVFRRRGFLEPLAAVYPRAMAEMGRRRLAAGDCALRDWIAEGSELMAVLDLPECWEGAFVNINDAAAWQAWLEEEAAGGA